MGTKKEYNQKDLKVFGEFCRGDVIEEIKDIIKNWDWDVEPCCYGIQADALLRKLEEIKPLEKKNEKKKKNKRDKKCRTKIQKK